MRIRNILGSAVKKHFNHSVAKLENGRYAAGRLTLGQTVEVNDQPITLDAAVEHWLATLPMHINKAQP